ncbi:MAG TPA: hypothetical protein VI387_14045, partial [Candidatus Brocadiales bacterium]|nr:hypothetical protein [Candidatus Brocadiales bacterium]
SILRKNHLGFFCAVRIVIFEEAERFIVLELTFVKKCAVLVFLYPLTLLLAAGISIVQLALREKCQRKEK